MPTIIVSYRRSDSKWITGRIVDRLERDYGKDDVFVDIDAIPLGMDFRDHLRNVLDRCDVLVAIIGPNWLAADETGQSRILEPADWVRIEIETALANNVPVIPVLIDRAPMPKVADLPESLHAFAFRQAAEVDTGRDFHVHMDRLVRAISQSAAKQRQVALPTLAPAPVPAPASEATPRSPASPPVNEPTPVSRSEDQKEGWPRRGIIAAVVAAAGLAAVAVMLTQRSSDHPAVISTGPSEPAAPSQDQNPQEPPEIPALPETPAPLDPPMSLDPPVRTETPVPLDIPVPPGLIEQPQPQRASLFEDEQTDPNGRHFNGGVTWRAVKMSSSPGQLAILTAIAEIVIPDRQLAVTFSLRANTDPNLPATHTIEVSFKVPAGFAQGGIANVPGILMKETDNVRGTPLAGLSANIRNGTFLIGLSTAAPERARNVQMLKDLAWFDIPIVYSNGVRAVLAVEKGPSGDGVFKDVFAAWRQ